MLTGLAIGGSSTATAYLSEIAPSHIRGMLVVMNELGLGVGCVLAPLVSTFLGDEQWRSTIAVITVPAVLQLLAFARLLQESPIWLARQGLMDEAKEAAEKLGLNLEEQCEADDVLGVEDKDQKPDATPSRFQEKGSRRKLLLALGCGLGHAMTATNTVLYYSRNILTRSGVEQPLLATLAVDATKLLGILTGVFIVEHVGRRNLLLFGTFFIVLGHVGIAISFQVHLPWLALACLGVFIYAWNISWSGLMLLVAAELLPASIRGIGLGAVYSVYWAVSGLEEQTLQVTFRAFTVSGTFFFYGGLSFLTLLFVLFFLPETGQASYGQLEAAEEDEASLETESSDISDVSVKI